jgi:hypothetical protein
MAGCVIYEAATSSTLHAFLTVVVCILLVLLEFLGAALIVAPRAVIRKLGSLLRAFTRSLQRTFRPSSSRHEPARPSREGA